MRIRSGISRQSARCAEDICVLHKVTEYLVLSSIRPKKILKKEKTAAHCTKQEMPGSTKKSRSCLSYFFEKVHFRIFHVTPGSLGECPEVFRSKVPVQEFLALPGFEKEKD